MKRAIFAITDEAARLAEKIARRLSGAEILRCKGSTASALAEAWGKVDALICIMAAGIVVRAIAPLLEDKRKDPAVLVLDQDGKFVIPLVSGHLGGANRLAMEVASITGGQAVITTASDVSGHTALDLWIRDLGLKTANPQLMSEIMTLLMNKGNLRVYSDSGLPPLPKDLLAADSMEQTDIIITIRADLGEKITRQSLVLHPPALSLGIGCNRGTSAQKIDLAVRQTLSRFGIAQQALCGIASIDIKKDERGLLEFALAKGLPLRFFPARALDQVKGIQASETVKKATGARGVCEPAAILAAGNGPLIVEKQKWKDVTTAIARAAWPWWEQAQGP